MKSEVDRQLNFAIMSTAVLLSVAWPPPLLLASSDGQPKGHRRIWGLALSYNSYGLAAENHIFMYNEDRTEESFAFRCYTTSNRDSGLGLALGGEFQFGIVNRPFWGNPATEAGAVCTEFFAGPTLRLGKTSLSLHAFLGLSYYYIAGHEEYTPSGGGGIDIDFYGGHGIDALWDKYLNDWVSGGERVTYPEIPAYSKFATLVNPGIALNLSERSVIYFDYVLRYDHGISHEMRFGIGVEIPTQ